MPAQFSTIIDALPTISQEELSMLKKAIDMFTKDEHVQRADTPFEEYIINAINKELEELGMPAYVSPKTIKDRNLTQPWNKAVRIIENFVKNNFARQLKTETETRAVLRICIKTLIENFLKINIPISFKNIITNAHRLPQTFDDSFPGYLKSGMAYLIVASIQRRKR